MESYEALGAFSKVNSPKVRLLLTLELQVGFTVTSSWKTSHPIWSTPGYTGQSTDRATEYILLSIE